MCSKIATRLNALTRQLVERSPFVLLATSDAEGNVDVSPRGDPPGSVRILDEETLLIPRDQETGSQSGRFGTSFSPATTSPWR